MADRKQKILVVYCQRFAADRNTIAEHLYAFKHYAVDAQVWHYNAAGALPVPISRMEFDLIVFHYTCLAERWNGVAPFRRLMNRLRPLADAKAFKVAFPQDEYIYSEVLCDFFREFAIDVVFTCYDEADRRKAYPDSAVGHARFIKTLPGYVDPHALDSVRAFSKPHKERKIDLGYRARKLPYWLGHHGTLKWRLTEEFTRASRGSNLKVDLSNQSMDVFDGFSWYQFLSDCRVVLGCEGGASLLDRSGKIRDRVEDFVVKFPGATFAETERECFAGQDGSISLFAVSPRHFEAAITKTCQALVVGTYEGILKPDTHYIPIAKDFSNVEEVLRKIQDVAYCEAMAERTFIDVTQSGQFSYAKFVKEVLAVVPIVKRLETQVTVGHRRTEKLFELLLRANDIFAVPLARWGFGLRTVAFKCIESLGLTGRYRKLKRQWQKN